MRRGTIITAAGLVAALSWAAVTPPAGATVHPYGPSWGRFTVAFPSRPAQSSLKSELSQHCVDAQGAEGLVVSKAKDVFADTATPPSPTYAVVVARFGNAKAAGKCLVSQRAEFVKPMVLTVAGVKAYEEVGAVPSSISGSSKPETLAVLLLLAGRNLYQAEAIAGTKAGATGFVRSFRPTG
jgi:hypothetical protein